MKVLRQSAAAAGFAAALLMAGCAHHNQIATTSTSDVGTISSTQAAQAGVIPGPAKVDSDGNVYTSSAAPGSGASLNDGTNTNVNNVPTRSKSTVVVTQTPIEPAPLVVETPAPIIVETPAPAPIVIETPAPAVVETPTMTSSSNVDDQTTTTTVKTTKRHRRMAKE
jgi:hypothetical protein